VNHSITQCLFYRDTQRKFWPELHSRKMPELLQESICMHSFVRKRKLCNSIGSSLCFSCQEMQTQI
jgi:hypothetical protein